MMKVTYSRKGNYIDPEPVSIEFVPPHTQNLTLTRLSKYLQND